MSINIKRCLFSIALICASMVSFLTKSKIGFQLSIAIIGVPLAFLFLVRLVLPEIKLLDEKSNEYSALSEIETFGSVVNLVLIGIWVITEVYCLMII